MASEKILLGTLCGAMLLAACQHLTEPAADPCDRTSAEGRLTEVSLSTTADSLPVISWSPAACGISYLEMFRNNNGLCVAGPDGSVSCAAHYRSLWRVGTGTLPFTANPGPATITGPVRFGVTPTSAAVEIAPDSIRVGDTLLLYVARPRVPGRQVPPWATVTFVVGMGNVQAR